MPTPREQPDRYRETDPASDLIAALWFVDDALQRASNRDVRCGRLSGSHRVLLLLLDALPELSVRELTRLLQADRATMARAVRDLEGLRLVQRRRDTRGRRCAALVLTQQGRATLRFGSGGVDRLVHRIGAALPAEDRHAAGRVCDEVAASVAAAALPDRRRPSSRVRPARVARSARRDR